MTSPADSPHTEPLQPKKLLRLIPLDDTVVFPNMGITLTIDVGDDERVVLVPRHENEFLEVGTIAEVTEQIRLPGGGRAVAISGEHRALIGAAQTGPEGELRVEVEERPDEVPVDKRTRELEREYRAVVEEILELRGDDGRIAAFLRAIAEPGSLADSAGYSPNLSYEQKVELLRTLDVTDRLELAVKLQRESLAELQVRKRIREDVQDGAEKQQREYFLRKQMDSIRKELGDDDASVAEEYRAKIEEADMPEEVSRAGAEGARPPRAHGRADRRVEHDPHLPRLADRRAVGQALGRAPRPGRGACRARRRPRRPGGRQGPRDRVPGRAQAARGPRHRGRPQVRGDPHADRPAGHRQDVDRRVDRPRDRPRVRAHVAGRRA